MRRASSDLPEPVGPISRSGALEAMATRSICSMSLLKAALRVSMPDLRKESDSVCLLVEA